MLRRAALIAVPVLALAGVASAAPSERAAWAKPQIKRVVQAGLLGKSVATFKGEQALSQQALAHVVAGLNERFAALAEPAPEPESEPDDPWADDEWSAEEPWPDETTTGETTTQPVEAAPTPVTPWPLYDYRAAKPAKAVSVAEFDRVLVRALGLGQAAESVRKALARAGLQPPARAGTETIARLVGLRYNHPAGSDELELLPDEPITRAEAAYSLAAALGYGAGSRGWLTELAGTLELPELSAWQRRVLSRAVDFVGFPYVWGGTSPTAGFDCSGFVWQVYKLTSYPGGGGLAGTLRGRTTYQMSSEVGREGRIYKTENLKPGDVLFFGRGPKSKPSEVDHTGIYLGDGWMVHSSGNGTTITPFAGWYERSFAWARRPLREAGLDR